MSDPTAVFLDSDTWSHLFAGRRTVQPQVPAWRRLLTGRSVMLTGQTRAELLFGALHAQWGTARMSEFRSRLDVFPVIHPTAEVVETWAQLRADCRRRGHPLHQKQHMGDAWIAATAATFGIPLLSGDAIYDDVPGVVLLTDTS